MTANRMSRRNFLQLSAAGTAGALLAACAGQPAAAPAAEEGGDMMAEEAVEIRLSHWWGEQHNHWLPIVEEKTNVTGYAGDLSLGRVSDQSLDPGGGRCGAGNHPA